jgi:DNA helicase-2/ATP-dependent DNA helicase PcrA
VPHADTVSPTLGLTGRERVTITDYKSGDGRDPAKARQRARESLQLQIYAMGYEALTGRLPDYLQLHFLDSGLVGRAEVDPKRLARAREKISTAAAGMRARDYRPKPDRMSCSYCPFREICPSSVAS